MQYALGIFISSSLNDSIDLQYTPTCHTIYTNKHFQPDLSLRVRLDAKPVRVRPSDQNTEHGRETTSMLSTVLKVLFSELSVLITNKTLV